jgi:GGDEF domain-containing protein
MLIAAGSIKSMIEDHNQRAARFLRMHTAEMQKVIASLTDALGAICADSEGTITHLRDLEHRIAKAPAIEDVRSFGNQLSKSLETLRADMVRRRERMEETLSQLRRKVETSPWPESNGASQSKTEALSGLPLRTKAESALDQVIQSGGHGYVAAFAVDRVHLINGRFGYAVGDEVLMLFQEHLKQNLKPGDQLFRWTGPVFIALLERASPADHVRTEVKHLTSAKLECTVQIGSRTVLLPVACTSAIFSLVEIPSTAALIEQIDTFVSGHLRT